MTTRSTLVSNTHSPQEPALLVTLLLVDSLHFVFARLMLPHANPFLSALFVMLIGTVEVGVFGVATGRLGVSVFTRHWRFFLAIGFCIGVSTAISYSAVALIDPGLRKSFFVQLSRLPRWVSLGMLGFLGLGVISSLYNAHSWRALAYSLADVYLLAMIFVLALVVAACRSLAGTRFYQLAI